MLDNVSNESILSLVCKKNELVQLWKLFSLNIFLIFLVFLIFSLCSDVLEQALMHSSSECTLWPDKRSSQLFPELTPQFACTSCEWVKLCTLKSRSPLKSKKKKGSKMASAFLEVGRYSFDNILCMPYTVERGGKGSTARQSLHKTKKHVMYSCYIKKKNNKKIDQC